MYKEKPPNQSHPGPENASKGKRRGKTSQGSSLAEFKTNKQTKKASDTILPKFTAPVKALPTQDPILAEVFNLRPVAHRPHAAQDSCECSPMQNHKFTQNITNFLWLHVTMYLMCGPRQLFFFFQCGTGMPKGWILLPYRAYTFPKKITKHLRRKSNE